MREDLTLVEGARLSNAFSGSRGGEIVAERLLDDQPRPALARAPDGNLLNQERVALGGTA